MKKYIAYAAAIGLALPVSFALPTPANAGHNTVASFCKGVLERGGTINFGPPFGDAHFDNLGECASWVNAFERDGGSQLTICKGAKALGLLGPDGVAKNFGDCMTNFEFGG